MTGHGGNRPGAGRKPRYGEKTRTMRVPESAVPVIMSYLGRLHAARDGGDAAVVAMRNLALLTQHATIPRYASRIAAGWPSPADDYVDKGLDFNEHLVQHKAATFVLTVSGHSMTGAGIFDGDEIIVDRALTPRSGDVVVAVINGELTVKRLHLEGNQVILMPENPAYRPIVLHEDEELEIFGVVTRVLHVP
ncbi:MAG: LexA family protein [Candidatus Dormibacteria bacterium]